MMEVKPFSLMWLLACALTIAYGVGTSDSHCEEIPTDIIVMITVYDANEPEPTVIQWGAGIVVSQTSNNGTAILTASHVVIPEERSNANWRVEVKFKDVIKHFVGNVKKEFSENKLDYAVVFIEPSQQPPLVSRISAQGKDAKSGLLSVLVKKKETQKVTAIGHAGGQKWSHKELIVNDVKTDTILFFENVGPGTSGGGVFDSSGRLVGMMRANTGPLSNATPIKYLIEKLENYDVPVSLKEVDESFGPKIQVDVCASVDPPIHPCLFRK